MPYRHCASRALSLFDTYAAYPPAKRRRALAVLREADTGTHDVLTRMLAADKASRVHAHVLWDAKKWMDRCATPDTRGHPGRTGSRLGAWRLGRLVGAGGMGAVYEARREADPSHVRVAIKCMHPWIVSPATQHAFERECARVAALEHPRIPGILDRGVAPDGPHWFAMRYVEGEPLDAWAASHGLDLRGRVELLMKASEVVAHVHAQGVLHQDIKPSNFIVDADGQVNLVDFGLASAVSGDGEAPRIALSRGYAAPEVATGQAPTEASDVYSLGVVMYQLLCGQWPAPLRPAWLCSPTLDFPAPARLSRMLGRARRDPAPPAGRRGSGRSRQAARHLDAIALRAVAPEPARRYGTMEAFRRDLAGWLDAHARARAAAARDLRATTS